MGPLPLGLKTALESGNCVLFLGAGVGWHLRDGDGNVLPDAAALAAQISDHFTLSAGSQDLAKVSKLAELRKGRPELDSYLRKRLANAEPDDTFSWITKIRWRAIYTTNYDNGIERAYEKAEAPFQNPVVITISHEYAGCDPRFQVPVYHIHGALFGNHTGIVITQDDYSKFRSRRRMLFEKLKEHFATSTFLYIGYRNNDPNWSLVLDELTEDFYPSKLPQSYRVAPNSDAVDVEILEDKSIHTIDENFSEFTAAAKLALGDSVVDPDLLGRLKLGVPADLQSAFEENPAALLRLLNSWEYVNQAPFADEPNVVEFLKGNRPNWSTIANKKYFERDLEPLVFDALLDYATLTTTKPQCGVVLATAGYGTTTLLRTLAVMLVRESIRPVFFHKPGSPVSEGDIEFATTLFDSAAFFIIDEASAHTKSIGASMDALTNLNRPGYFLLGARRNEWPHARFKQKKAQFLLEALSDVEIDRLIDFLAVHRALNKLDGLDRTIQFSEIKRRCNQDLLVAMRSATEGAEFDAIIESEYHGIPSDVAKAAYLAICALYQYGAYLRDLIVAKLIGVDHSELYASLGSAVDGVIIFDCLDEAQGTFAARARHRVIAQIVWERCGDRAKKDSLLHKSIELLNLTYRADVLAFDQLVRSDRIVDEISTLEGKISFFDSASQKDPDNPYVQQHYARMLLREKKLDLALAKIDSGIAINQRNPPKILMHTRAVILAEMMIASESENIGRKRMAQAEDALRSNLKANAKDHYSYQSLATLYFEWAKRVEAPEESAQYLQKAEETVNEGIRSVRDREGLWIVSADIQNWLGNDPARLKSLRRAVFDSPGSIVGRFLLARALRQSGEPEEAKNVLQPVLETAQDEYRAFLEYALALVDLGQQSEAIKILELSTLYGHSDCRYLATHGGLLFLAGEYPRAQQVFEAYKRKDFDEDELRTPYFKPLSPASDGTSLHLSGTVVVVNSGYCFIEAPPCPKVICPSSKYGGVAIRPGMKVGFILSFTARGPVAYYPTLISH